MSADCRPELTAHFGTNARRRTPIRRTNAGRRVGDLLRAELLAGRFDRGALPIEGGLSASFHVSRNAVREALDLLRREGLVERKQGTGTLVVSQKTLHAFDHLHSVADSFAPEVPPPTFEVIDAELYPAPPSVIHHLCLEPGDDAFYLERKMSINGEPFSLRSSWMPPVADRFLEHVDLTKHHFYELVERHLGVVVNRVRARVRVEAAAADGTIASLLGIAPYAPVFFIERVTNTIDGRPIEFGFTRCRGDRVALETDMTREAGPRIVADDPVYEGLQHDIEPRHDVGQHDIEPRHDVG
jgi:GntR family transcriptional regulator